MSDGPIDVADFGAFPDGTDCTAAVQAAVDSAAEPDPLHWDGHRRPCTRGDEVRAAHEHTPEDWMLIHSEDPRPLPPEAD